jgi:AraC-like DNA-binding protein
MAAHALMVVAEPSLRLRLWRSHARDATMEAVARSWFRLVFIEAGQGAMHVQRRRLEVEAGDVCWIAPGQTHDLTTAKDASAWMLAFSADAVEPGESAPVLFAGAPRHPWQVPFMLAAKQRQVRVTMPGELRASWRATLARLDHELTAQPPGYASAARALLMLLLLDAARLVSAHDVEALPAVGPVRSALVEEALRFIDHNYRRPIGLRDVALAVARSPAHLTDRVRRETGQPIGVWLLERRMAEARRLLLTTELSIEQVAANAGFGDPRHFARQFRRLNDLPPQAWRAQQRTPHVPGPPKEATLPPKCAPL